MSKESKVGFAFSKALPVREQTAWRLGGQQRQARLSRLERVGSGWRDTEGLRGGGGFMVRGHHLDVGAMDGQRAESGRMLVKFHAAGDGRAGIEIGHMDGWVFLSP